MRISKTELIPKFILNTPTTARFVSNEDNSVWKPTKAFTWLGISVGLNKGCLYISEEYISNLLETMKYITNNPYISTRTSAKLAGKILSP